MSPFRYYGLAGETVAADADLPLSAWETFAIPEGAAPPLCRIRRGKTVTLHGIGSVAVTHPVVHLLRAGDGMLLGDRDCTRLTLCGDFSDDSSRDAWAEGLLLAGVAARLSLAHTVLLHGAFVDVPTVGGILFIGASGVGKSTQAELWHGLRGGAVLNGDRVFLRKTPSACHAVGYGSPFAGSSSYRVNRSAEVTCVVTLSRAGKGEVQRLSAADALTSLLCRALMPSWDAAMAPMTTAAMETLTTLAETIPTIALSVPHRNPAAGVDLLESCLAEERSRSWKTKAPTAG